MYQAGYADHAAERFDHRGRAVQVDPITPTLIVPGTKRLKLISDDPLSKFAFKFDFRRYTGEGTASASRSWTSPTNRNSSHRRCSSTRSTRTETESQGHEGPRLVLQKRWSAMPGTQSWFTTVCFNAMAGRGGWSSPATLRITSRTLTCKYPLWQGRTLFHFSAQPEPILTLKTSP